MLGLIVRSIRHYRRTHVVVMLAVAVATAVIGGSLIVGDSVRASLRDMTLNRLGGITHVVHSPRFVRQELAADLAARSPAATIAPALLLTGSIERRTSTGELRRTANVFLSGVEDAGWSFLNVTPEQSAGHDPDWLRLLPKAFGLMEPTTSRGSELAVSTPPGVAQPTRDGIVLGWRTAGELGATVGDQVSVWVERPSSIPRDSLLGERDDVALEIVLTVEGILAESAGASRFSLEPGQQLPHNAFLALSTFQERLDLNERVVSPRNPIARPARVNTLLIGATAATAPANMTPDTLSADASLAADLQQRLNAALTPDDLGLRLRAIDDGGYLSVEADSMILEDTLVDAVTTAAGSMGFSAAPTLVYLINEINAATRTDQNSRYSMYSIVAGLEFHHTTPLGPFRLHDGSPVPELGDDDVLLSDWMATDLQAAVGDVVQLRWHDVGSHGDLPEIVRPFTVRGILPAEDPVSINPDLTPFVDGVTNVKSFSDWDQPFEMKMERITARDDAWWEAHRAAPKSFVSLATARKLWGSRFGSTTSVRVASDGVSLPPDRLELLRTRLIAETMTRIEPEKLGLFARPIRAEGLIASAGANDFSQLFLGFSFFLILSAVLLASLMFQLSIRQRVAQVGLMEAVGFTARRARRVFVIEGAAVAACGTAVGVIAAIYFAQLMIVGLTTWWSGAVGTSFLKLDVQPMQLLMASAATLGLSAVVIWNAVRRTSRRSPRELLAGLASDDLPSRRSALAGGLTWMALVGSLAVAIGLPLAVTANLIPSGEAFGGLSWKVVGFFLAGFAWLSSGLLSLQRLLQRRSGDAVESSQVGSLTGLALANAARNPQRSLLTTALMALAAFVIFAVGAGRRNPVSEAPDRQSGNGGFTLVAESSLPVLFDLNTAEGRTRLGLNRDAATTIPDGTTVFPFRMKPGQDASCLNLFQATVPTLLGATPEFLQRGGFRFADTPGLNPWTLLTNALPDYVSELDTGSKQLPAIPVIGDLNTLQFSLKKRIGDVILMPSADNPEFALQVVGMLDSSLFQGVLVMSDENLKCVDPDVSGFRYFLIETADAGPSPDQAANALETALQSFGLDATHVSERLASFLAVQNTYLSTFQMLGGLGLLVGTFGLSAVMLRNVIERRSEIALLRAIGFRWHRIAWLVLSENCLLLAWGIATGTAAALIAMLPHLISTGADVPWRELGITLLAVLAVGTVSAVFPIRASLRVPVREVLTAG